MCECDIINNDQAGYFPETLHFTGGNRVVGFTLETRAVLELTYLVPQLLWSSSFRLNKFSYLLDLERKRDKQTLTLVCYTYCFGHQKWRLHSVILRRCTIL